MPELSRRRREPEQPEGNVYGVVVTAPSSLTDSFNVRIPSFSNRHVFEIRRWMPRGEDKPAVDDIVLVVFDDRDEPWVPAWWPG